MPVGEAFKPRSSALMVPVLRSSSFFGAGLYAADHIQALSKPLYVLQEHSIPSILMGYGYAHKVIHNMSLAAVLPTLAVARLTDIHSKTRNIHV